MFSPCPAKVLGALRNVHFQQLAPGLGSKFRGVGEGFSPSSVTPRPQEAGTLLGVELKVVGSR